MKEPTTEENERATGITIEAVCELLLMIDRKMPCCRKSGTGNRIDACSAINYR